MLAHGFAYHWPLAWKIIGGIIYFAVVMSLGVIVLNWISRDYRLRACTTLFFAVLYTDGVISQHQWWYAPYAFWAIVFTVIWGRKFKNPRVEDPVQLHPLRWFDWVRDRKSKRMP